MLLFLWVSSLAYPNLLGTKGYVVVVVVVVVPFFCYKNGSQKSLHLLKDKIEYLLNGNSF
jgi:hypothetical protein